MNTEIRTDTINKFTEFVNKDIATRIEKGIFDFTEDYTERNETPYLFEATFLNKTNELICAFLLIDIRHEPQPVDLDFFKWLGEHQIPFSIVFTKADKIKPGTIEKRINNYFDELKKDWEELPPHFVTSASKGNGKEELLGYIQEINDSIKEN